MFDVGVECYIMGVGYMLNIMHFIFQMFASLNVWSECLSVGPMLKDETFSILIQIKYIFFVK